MVRFKESISFVVLAALCALPGCAPKAVHKSSVAEVPSPRASQSTAPDSTTTDDLGSEPAVPEHGPTTDAEEPDVIDDGADADEDSISEAGRHIPHPFDNWSSADLERALTQDLSLLGSLSIGTPNAGALLNGVQAEDNDLFTIVSPSAAWGTRETLDYLAASLRKVHAEYPDTKALHLGDISAKQGGPIRPHISHQCGRDVDISYFYKDTQRWYARGTEKNLDLPRNWAFVRALVAETDVEMILIDNSIQALLKRYALESGEDPDWVDQIFRGKAGALRPIIRHARGHATHLHIRFFNPIAQESARRAHELLAKHRLVSPLQSYISHRVKKGETLGMISKKYRTTVPALKSANGLRSSKIRERSTLRIPATTGVRVAKERVSIPARRLPPPRRSTATATATPSAPTGPGTDAARGAKTLD